MTYDMRQSYRGYVFSADALLNDSQFDQLIACFHRLSNACGSTLGGRRQTPSIELEPFGTVRVKSYRRGGLMARFNRRHYLDLKGRPTRSEKEFEWLNRMRAIGIRAPEPLAAAHQGRLVYRCWLITREVSGATTLAQLSIDRPQAIETVRSACARQVEILVAHRILHPDLHPGNVLVDPDGQSWIIDFDKAGYYHGRRQRLAQRYRQRWRRAVRKHGLPSGLEAVMANCGDGRPD